MDKVVCLMYLQHKTFTIFFFFLVQFKDTELSIIWKYCWSNLIGTAELQVCTVKNVA